MANRKWLFANDITLVLVSVIFFALPVAGQTADKIIAKHVAARGGLKKILAVRTMTVTGKLIGPGMNSPIRVQLKRPKLFRMELDVQGKTIIRVFDGKTGWQINPLVKAETEILKDDNLNQIEDEAEIDSPLIHYRAKGHRVELVGKESVQGKDCYKLKLTLKTGTVMYQYLDAKSYLEVREELIRTVNGQESVIEESIEDYKKVGKIWCPHRFDSNTKGSADHYLFLIEKIEFNLPLDDALFKMPSTQPQDSLK